MILPAVVRNGRYKRKRGDIQICPAFKKVPSRLFYDFEIILKFRIVAIHKMTGFDLTQ